MEEASILYYVDYELPMNISYPKLNSFCKQKDIEWEPLQITRYLRFYGKTESDLRWLCTNLQLKLITLEYETLREVVSKKQETKNEEI